MCFGRGEPRAARVKKKKDKTREQCPARPEDEPLCGLLLGEKPQRCVTFIGAST